MTLTRITHLHTPSRCAAWPLRWHGTGVQTGLLLEMPQSCTTLHICPHWLSVNPTRGVRTELSEDLAVPLPEYTDTAISPNGTDHCSGGHSKEAATAR